MMRSHILLLVACTNSLNFSPRRVHLRKLLRRKNRKPKRPTMLRNQDRPELLLFVTTNAARWTDGVERPGVARLVAEAKDAGTPSIWICEDDPKPVGDLKPTPWPNAPALPCPQALQDARASCSAWGHGSAGAFGQGVGFRSPTGFGSSSQIHIDGVPASFASATRRATPGRSTPSVHRAAFVVTNRSSSGRSWLRSIVGLFGLRFFLRKSFRKWTRRGLKLRLLVHATRSRMCDRIIDRS